MHYPNYQKNEKLIEEQKKTANNEYLYSKLIISLLFIIYYHFSNENYVNKLYSIIFYFFNSKIINFIIYLIQTFEFKLIEHIVGIDNIKQKFIKHNQIHYYLNIYLTTQDVFLYVHILFVNIYYSSSIGFNSTILLIFPFFVIIINILLIVICLFKRRETIFMNNLKLILLVISLSWIYVNFSIILYSITFSYLYMSYIIHNPSNFSEFFIKYISSLNIFYSQHLIFGLLIYYFYWKVISLLYEKDLLLKIRQEKIIFLSEIHYSSGINYVSFQYENYEIRNISEIFEFYMKNGGNISRKDNNFLNNEYEDISKENNKEISNSFYLNTLKESHIIDEHFKFSPENFIKIENNNLLYSNKTKKSSTNNNLVAITLKESIELFIKDNINDNSFLSNDYQVLGFYMRNMNIKQIINSNIIGNTGVVTNHKMRKENLTFSNNTFGTKSSPRLKRYLEYKYDLMINNDNFYTCLSNISMNKDVYLIYAKTKKTTNQGLYDKQSMIINKNKSFLDYVEMIFIKINPYPIYISSNYYNQKTNNLLNTKNNENSNNIFIQNIVENDSFTYDNNHILMKNKKRLSKFSVNTSEDDSFEKFEKYKEKDVIGRIKKKKIFEKVKIIEAKGLTAQLLNNNNSIHKNEIKNNNENKENLFDSLLEISSSSNEKNISELLIGRRSNTFHFKKINYENFNFNSNEKQRQSIKITSSLSKKNHLIKGSRKDSKYKIITKKKNSSKTSKGLLYLKKFEEDVNRLYIKKDYVDNFPLNEINENIISNRKSKLKEIDFMNKSKNKDKNHNVMLDSKEYTSKTKKLYEYTNILISKLSHEIKTSLISIKVISEKLVEKYIENYDIYKSFKKIGSLSNIIIFLVYDLSDFLQNKTSPISYSSFTLGEFKESIKDLCEAYMMLFNKENTVDINYSIEEDLILSNITSDEKKLKQIILNLLSNSIKNTIKGKIKMDIRRNKQIGQNKYFQLNSSNMKNKKSVGENSLFIEISDEAGGVPKEYFNYINIIYNDSIYKEGFNFLQRNSYSYNNKKLPSFSKKYSSKSGLGNGFILSKKLAKELGIVLTCEYIYESSFNKYNSYNNISLPNELTNKLLNKKIIGTKFIIQMSIDNNHHNEVDHKQIGNINLINSINSSQSNKNLGFYSFNPNNNLLVESVECTSEMRVENKNTSSFFNIQTSKLSENEDIQYDYNFYKSKKEINDNKSIFSINEDNKSNSSKTVSNHSFIVEFDYFKNRQFTQFYDEVEEIKSRFRGEDSENDDEDGFKTPLELLNNLKFYSSNNNFNSNKTNKENETSNATKIPISDKNIISNRLLIVKDHNQSNRIDRRSMNNNVSVDNIKSYSIEINSKILPKLEGKVNEIATIMNFTSSLNNTHIENKEKLLNINKISSFNKQNKHRSDTSTMNILKIDNNAFESKCRIVENRNFNNKPNSTMNLKRCNIDININDGLNKFCIENNFNTNNLIPTQKLKHNDNIHRVSSNNYFNFNKESHKLHLSFQGINHNCLHSPCLDNKAENIYIRKPTNISSLEVSFNDSVKYESGKNISQLKFLSPVSIISEMKIKQRSGVLKSSLEVIKDEEIESNKNEKYEYICILVDDKADIVNSECRLLSKKIEEKLGKDMKEKWKFLKLKDGFELINSVYHDLSSKSNKIKLVLCDEMMDFMNGSEALGIIDKLYEKVNAKKFPFYFISAFTNNDFFYQVQRKDWKIEFLEKPLNSKAAGNLVDKYFNI